MLTLQPISYKILVNFAVNEIVLLIDNRRACATGSVILALIYVYDSVRMVIKLLKYWLGHCYQQ